MSTTQFTATFTQKSLVAALTQVRKGALVVTDTIKDGRVDKAWLDKPEHVHGYDRVIIRVNAGSVTLITTDAADTNGKYFNAWNDESMGWDFVQNAMEGCRSTFARVEAESVEGNGIVAVPVRILHDYIKTWGARDVLTIAYAGEQDYEHVTSDFNRNNYKTTVKRETVQRQTITITCGRDRTRMVATLVSDLQNGITFDNAPAVVEELPAVVSVKNTLYHIPTPAEQRAAAERDQEAYFETMTGQSTPWFPAAMHGPAWDATTKPRIRVPLAVMRAYHGLTDDADTIADAAIAAITGEEYSAPTFVAPAYVAPAFVAPAMSAPTPIRPTEHYTPRVGDTILVCYRHENGTTTNRIVDVQRVGPSLFRGYDRTYGRVRNFEYRHIASIARSEQQAAGSTGKEAVA